MEEITKRKSGELVSERTTTILATGIRILETNGCLLWVSHNLTISICAIELKVQILGKEYLIGQHESQGH